ncbi:hypothetical protein [Pseudonocardia sp. D17]|uniref:hypothetical protein n=1 Tax=Pseudonocardia sp. D17 TaxID=882661 RepID=UPI002B379131|nr:hypothetical protein PSD17_28190 [Pseudonocardia sp. D17]
MAWFSKRNSSGIVPDVILSQLGDLGHASLAARAKGVHVDDPRFDWSNFYSKFLPAYQSNLEQAIAEIHTAAGDDLFARFGGSRVVAEFDGNIKEPLYLDMLDAGLQLMYDRGLSSHHLTGYEADRWFETRGDLRATFDRIVDVEVPEGQVTTIELALGQKIMVAQMGPEPTDNRFYIERIDDHVYRAFSMREAEWGDGILKRCEEPTIPVQGNADGALRALARYLRLPPYWAYEEMRPYFPEKRNLH